MTKPGLFTLSAEREVRIVLHVRAQEEKYELVHSFREPTAADKKAYWGHITRTELFDAASATGGGTGMDYLGANELLYD
ncbi:MAG: hypothetical protein U9N45_00160, partial [Gemmatimonadota bacterium]|nr:hypothetical protein [Gemmatimonadota bacterium]